MSSHVVRVLVNGGAKPVSSAEERRNLATAIVEVMPDAKVWFTSERETLDQLIKRAIADGATTLVAGGGDGTINAVASVVVGTNRTLGVLPLGTLNHFAKDLGIPSDIAEAVALLGRGTVRTVDAAGVNERIFLNNSGLGLYPDIVHQREIRQQHGSSKWPAAVSSAVRALLRFRVFGIRIVVDGTPMQRRTAAVLVGNNPYTTEGGIEPRRDTLNAGTLSLYVPHSHHRAPLLWFAARALASRDGALRGFDVLLAKEFRIETHHARMRVSLDGEVMSMETPLEFRSLPGALRVIAPPAISPEPAVVASTAAASPAVAQDQQ